jgi:predicted transcriptional regulator
MANCVNLELKKNFMYGIGMGQKKVFSTRVDEDRIKELKHLAVDTDRSLGDLLEEAIKDIVAKNKKKPAK